MYAKYENLEDKYMMRHSNPLALSAQGIWLREVRGNNHYVMHAQGLHYEKSKLYMNNFSIFEFDNQDKFIKRIK